MCCRLQDVFYRKPTPGRNSFNRTTVYNSTICTKYSEWARHVPLLLLLLLLLPTNNTSSYKNTLLRRKMLSNECFLSLSYLHNRSLGERERWEKMGREAGVFHRPDDYVCLLRGRMGVCGWEEELIYGKLLRISNNNGWCHILCRLLSSIILLLGPRNHTRATFPPISVSYWIRLVPSMTTIPAAAVGSVVSISTRLNIYKSSLLSRTTDFSLNVGCCIKYWLN